MLKKYDLGRFFWAPISHKRYQNTSGFIGVEIVASEEHITNIDDMIKAISSQLHRDSLFFN